MMLLVLLMVFAGTMLLIFAGYVLVNRRRLAAAAALRDRLAPAMAGGASATILKDEKASDIPALDRLLAGKGITAAVSALLERAGSRMSVGEFVLLTALSGAVGLLMGRRIGPVVTPIFVLVLGCLPYLNLKRLQAARLKAFQAQLPEAIDMLVNAMKSGYSLQAALKFAGDEMPTPLGPEFVRVYDEQRLGMDMRNALVGLQERMDTLDCKMFVTALLLQRETGGNLAEVLGTLAVLMRERVALRGQIETLTAEPKMSAIVLSALPVLLFIVVAILNRDYLSPLWTVPFGRLLLMYGMLSIVLGYIVLRKIGKIDI